MDGGGSKEDPPGGKSLMEEIQALFAPPGGRDKRETQIVQLHPYFKRPGKGHNHDCCDACGEGGDLICCDSCPSSFHLTCHAPPLEDEDIPKGDWVCFPCHYKEVTRSGTILRSSNDQMQPPPGEEEPKKVLRPPRLAAKKACEAITPPSKSPKLYRLKYNAYITSKPSTDSPFDSLIAASQFVGAVEFSLPKELQVLNERLPFSWKWSDEAREDLETYPRNCVVCQRTSRGVPSLACDFCSSVYHLDCLDPPLCEIPKDNWMCPTHVEHFVDSHLLDSSRFSERIKLWDKYARAPVDTDSVRMEFFRKIHSGKRGSNRLIRSRVPNTNRVRVPELVKAQYRSPGQGFPSEGSRPPFGPTRDGESDRNEWLAGVIALQSSFMSPEEGSNDSSKKTPHDKGNESDETASNCSVDVNDEDADILSDEVRASLNAFISRRKSQLAELPPLIKEFLALQKAEELFQDYAPQNSSSSIRPRAVFTPLNVSKVPCNMKYRSLDIGFGRQNTLDLSKYGHCNYVSPLCATVFYDQYTRAYELINYSEHGCIVDNTVYCLELRKSGLSSSASCKTNPKVMAFEHPNASSPQACHCEMSISAFFRKKKSTSSSCTGDETNNTSSASSSCSSSIADINYNLNPSSSHQHNSIQENSAVLNHGSYIRFGCLQFVFSIMEFEPEFEDPTGKEESEEQV